MGTGAVYVTLAGLKNHPGHPLTVVETIFYFLNMVLFLLNTSTLLLQFISELILIAFMLQMLTRAPVYPRQARRIITNPSKGIFVPIMVCPPVA